MTLAVKFQEPCDPTDPRPDAAATQRHVDVAFDRVCVQKMESLVLQELGWRLNPPTPAGIIPRLLILLGHDPSDDEFADICARTDVYALAILYDVNFSAARATCVAGAIVAVVLEDREGYDRDEVIRAIVTAFDDPERIGTESIVACARLVDDFRAVLSSSSAGDAIAGE
jgi:cyclin D1/2/4